MRIRDWISDVGCSDLDGLHRAADLEGKARGRANLPDAVAGAIQHRRREEAAEGGGLVIAENAESGQQAGHQHLGGAPCAVFDLDGGAEAEFRKGGARSEEHTSELQSLMRNSYAVFCLKKNKQYTSRTWSRSTHT